MLAKEGKELKVFALDDRTKSIKVTKDGFVYPGNFDPANYFDKAFGTVKGEPELIRVKTYGLETDYWRSSPMHPSQKEVETREESGNDYSVFELKMYPYAFEFKQELLEKDFKYENEIYTVTLTIMQSVDKYKVVFISLFIEVLTKLVLQYPLMILAYKLGIGAYCGNIAATIIATMSTVIISVSYMKIKMNISLRSTLVTTLKVTGASLIMYLVLMILDRYIPVLVNGRIHAIIIVALYALVGGGIYFAITYKPLFKKIFGKEILDKLFGKVKKSNS